MRLVEHSLSSLGTLAVMQIVIGNRLYIYLHTYRGFLDKSHTAWYRS